MTLFSIPWPPAIPTAYVPFDQLDDKTSMITLNLLTGEKKRFTTANREGLLHVRISGSTIAALSLRGYCHVWKYDDTFQCSSFRVPSLEYNQFLVSGQNIVLEYSGYLIHWSWDTRITRTIDIEDSVVTVALHPSKGQITTIHYCEQRPLSRRKFLTKMEMKF
jgi:hypothetical protein